MAERGAKKQASNQGPEAALDRTLYWTLSFYLPRSKLKRVKFEGCDPASDALQRAIDPLFNDIADRARQGKVPDKLYSAGPKTELTFHLPRSVSWMTEGCAFQVEVDDGWQRRALDLRRFWYRYPNDALSWNLSFAYHYAQDLDSDRAGKVPTTYYFLSLLQKLAWPKEFDPALLEKQAWPDDLDASLRATDVDKLTKMRVGARGCTASAPFWSFIGECYETDRNTLADGGVVGLPEFDEAVAVPESIEIPGLAVRDSRSSFFFHDSEFFKLIQPVENERVVKRRTRVRADEFIQYPGLISDMKPDRSSPAQGAVLLDPAYWQRIRGDEAAETRLAYLFLAGFNQNIIDFTNQEAAEVLDSLDPIYPKSEEQEEEGFVVRYANPRAMITYAPRSRSLEVGNDYIGTCPYAFLIHALAMHNEALTREQEEETFARIKEIQDAIEARKYVEAENAINGVRRRAFDTYDRHRYINPFRYDTERDVFEQLENLRGSARLRASYEAGLTAMEEEAADLHARLSAAGSQTMTVLFGLLGVSGVIQILFEITDPQRSFTRLELVWMIGGPLVAVAAFGWLVWRWAIRRAAKRG